MTKKEKTEFFKQSLEDHKGIVFKVAKTYCYNEIEREDLIQEISIQIWRSLDRYNAEYKLSTWLYRISLNVAISFIRRSKKQALSDRNPTKEIEETKQSDHLDKLNLLEEFIYELNELDKALILLYLEGKSHLEISRIIGTSPSNVGTKISRIKEKLKKRFFKEEAL